jgi:molybdenum cofactor guanylyltransferase
VLVGGRSSRMKRDKALLPFRGVPLAQWIAATVAEASGSATLIGPPELYSGLGFPVISDLYPGEGPLGGILTALRHSQTAWNLITACDMPELDTRLLARLLDAAERAGVDVLLPITPDGRAQPLCAVYHSNCISALGFAFSTGIRAVSCALGALRVLRLPIEELSPFQNVNTPEDWAAYAS